MLPLTIGCCTHGLQTGGTNENVCLQIYTRIYMCFVDIENVET